MKKGKPDMEDELRSEYDLKSLRVRRFGRERRNFSGTVRLEPDVAEMFANADAVNQALRFLIKVRQENQSLVPETQPNSGLERTDESS